MKRKVTMADIARKANISYTTVSNVLNERYKTGIKIKPEMIELVKKVAKELGWVPNRVAQALASKKSHLIMMVFNRIGGYYSPKIVEEIEEEIEKKGYTSIISITKDDPAKLDRAIEDGISLNCDGMIFNASTNYIAGFNLLEKYNIPFVFCDLFSRTAKHKVQTDDYTGMWRIMEHIHQEKGHTEILYLNIVVDAASVYSRLDAVMDYQKQFDEVSVHTYGATIPNATPNAERTREDRTHLETDIREMVTGTSSPTVIVAWTDSLAHEVIAILHKAGFRVPEDISVTGYSGLVLPAWLHLPYELTTVYQDYRNLAGATSDLLFDLIEHPDKRNDPVHIKTPVTFMPGNTVKDLSAEVLAEFETE